jgi:hypothetical protein
LCKWGTKQNIRLEKKNIAQTAKGQTLPHQRQQNKLKVHQSAPRFKLSVTIYIPSFSQHPNRNCTVKSSLDLNQTSKKEKDKHNPINKIIYLNTPDNERINT